MKRTIATGRGAIWIALVVALTTAGDRTAVPGLPFVEDFTDADLRDGSRTLADWDTDEGLLRMPRASRSYPAFSSAQPVPGGSGTLLSVAIGDVDGDGDLDVVWGRQGATNAVALNGGSAAPFAGGTALDVGTEVETTTALALGDVDRDGDLDLVVGNNGQPNRLHLNNGSADPWGGVAGLAIGSQADQTRAIALGDVDGDGDLDLVAGNRFTAHRVYLNDGTADPWSGAVGLAIPASDDTRSIALGDVDLDGDLDLLTGAFQAPTRLFKNNGTADPWGGVAPIDVSADVDPTQAIALADFDGDGRLDLVAGGGNRVYLNNGSPDPWNGVSGIDIPLDGAFEVLISDIDRDGDLDVVGHGIVLNNGTARPWDDVDRLGALVAVGVAALGDFNGDGYDDAVIDGDLRLNLASSNPWQNSSGSGIGVGDPQDTLAVALGDVDRDGDLDLVVGNSLATDRLFVNAGPPSFPFGTPSIDITSDLLPTAAVVLGDVDGDGDLDLIAGIDSLQNRLYLGDGTSSPWSGAVGSDIGPETDRTRALALGDVDRDGDLDLVAGNDSEPSRLYLNNGTSNPWSGVSGIDISSDIRQTRSVALGDVDGDGDLDLVTGNADQTQRLYLNDGSSSPWAGVVGLDITSDAHDTRSIALGDIDRDGDLDLVAGNDAQPNRVYWNNGSSDPWAGAAGIAIDTDADPTRAIVLADADNDGDLDLLTGNRQASQRVYIFDASSLGWSSGTIPTSSNATTAIAVGDLDGNGSPDVVAGNDLQGVNRIYPGGSSRNGWFVESGENVTADAGDSRAAALGDVDGDGDLDLVVGDDGAPARLYTYPWDGTSATIVGPADSRNVRDVVLVDVDADGDLDLAAGNDGQANRLYLNDGSPSPWSGVTGRDISSDAGATRALVFGDLDGDGDIDAVAANYGQTNRLYLNDGTSDPWSGVVGADITADTDPTLSAVLGDVDRDGDLDLIVGNDSPASSRLYLNNGTSAPWDGAVAVDIATGTSPARSLALGDVDGDGDLDLVVGLGGQPNRLYPNNGSADPWGGEPGIDIGSEAEETYDVGLVDVDHDGDLDLIVANDGQPARLYLNDGTNDPWSGAAGIPITGDAHATRALALGDVDRDGIVDAIVANRVAENRYYRPEPRALTGVAAYSLRVDAESEPITNARLTAIDDGRVDYWLSNDGGVRWRLAYPGEPTLFPTPGGDLRWRAELSTHSPRTRPQIDRIEIETLTFAIGDRVWLDLDGDGLQDPQEPGLQSVAVALYSASGALLALEVTDGDGHYLFDELVGGENYYLQFIAPPGFVLSPQDVGGDDFNDSDADPTDGNTAIFALAPASDSADDTRWDAGMSPACEPPDEPIYLSAIRLSTDGNEYPILDFQDPNQPTQVTGYNVYRAPQAALVTDPGSLVASDVTDMDEGTPNAQWVDSSGEPSPSGIWYFQVTAFNHRCPAPSDEGPF